MSAWYIVHPDEEYRPDYDPATARVAYGPFNTKAEAEAFANEPANRYFDEPHGPMVEREIPADDRLVTEESMRLRATDDDVVGRQIGELMAEYDRRGAELERLRRECFELHTEDADAIAEQAEGIDQLRAECDALSQLLRRMARRSILFRRLARVAFRQLR